MARRSASLPRQIGFECSAKIAAFFVRSTSSDRIVQPPTGQLYLRLISSVYSGQISAGTNVSAPGPGQIVRIRNWTDAAVVGVIDPSGTLSRLSRANTFCGPLTSIMRGIFGSTMPDTSSATILAPVLPHVASERLPRRGRRRHAGLCRLISKILREAGATQNAGRPSVDQQRSDAFRHRR